MLRVLISLFLVVMLSGCTKKPQGRYVARVQTGVAFVELSYDFRQDGHASSWILSNGAAVAANGTWRLSEGKVLFEGTAINPQTKASIPISHFLKFDGDDLFREDLTVRFVRQK